MTANGPKSRHSPLFSSCFELVGDAGAVVWVDADVTTVAAAVAIDTSADVTLGEAIAYSNEQIRKN